MIDTIYEMMLNGITDALGNFAIKLVINIINILSFPLYAYGLFKLSKKKGVKNRWIAFIPFLNVFIVGKMVGHIQIMKKKIPNIGILLVVFWIVSRLPIPLVGAAFNYMYIMLFWVCIHRIYEMFKPENADILLIMGFVSGFLTPFFIFAIRNNNKTYSKLVIDDDGDGIFDREFTTNNEGYVTENVYSNTQVGI